MAVSIVHDPATLKLLKRAQEGVEYFHHNLEKIRALKARYVVVLGHEVMGGGDTPEAAWETAGGPDRADDGAVLLMVPRENETFLF